MGGNEAGFHSPQRSVSKGPVSRMNPASCLEEAGSRTGGLKQPVLTGCSGLVSPSIEHVTDVRGAAASSN